MKISVFVLLALVALAPTADAGSVSQTFPVSLDRAWSTTEKVLKILGWEIDTVDRSVGWIITDSRKLDGEDYGVYAKGMRIACGSTSRRTGRTGRRSRWSAASSSAS